MHERYNIFGGSLLIMQFLLSGHAKFGIGYLFYLSRGLIKTRGLVDSETGLGWGDRFLTKLIHHYGPDVEKLNQVEFISLMLTLYLRQSTEFYPKVKFICLQGEKQYIFG